MVPLIYEENLNYCYFPPSLLGVGNFSYLWIAGVVMPAIYLVVYYQAGLYADFGINIYYLLASLYGWWSWRHRKPTAEKPAVAITRMPLSVCPLLLLVFLVLWLLIAWILLEFTDSTVPWLDSFTTALSVVGMWMLARKYVEQWISWIAVDVVCCGLYWYKGLYFTAALYGLYALIALSGYFKWKQMMLKQ